MTDPAMTDREALLRERADVEARMAGLAADDDALAGSQQRRERASDPAGGDGDRESVERGSIRTQMHRLQQRLDRIDAALAEVEAGTYGRCRHCGEAIAAERLEALPGVDSCIACAR
jgi:RNA polymerase-binding transcription factor DksA